MKTIAFLFVIFFASTAFASDWSWTKSDVVLEAVDVAITVVDYGQTNDIRNHAGMIELNPILGRRPSKVAVRNYFAAVIPVHALISAALPRKTVLFGEELNPRKAWQYFYLGVEATATLSNYHGGLRLSW